MREPLSKTHSHDRWLAGSNTAEQLSGDMIRNRVKTPTEKKKRLVGPANEKRKTNMAATHNFLCVGDFEKKKTKSKASNYKLGPLISSVLPLP